MRDNMACEEIVQHPSVLHEPGCWSEICHTGFFKSNPEQVLLSEEHLRGIITDTTHDN